MNRRTIILTLAAILTALGLAACQTTLNAVSTVNDDIAHLSKYSVPVACGVVKVAEGYFHALQSRIPPATVALEAKAEAAVASICANPPTDAISALASAYSAIQAYSDVQAK